MGDQAETEKKTPEITAIVGRMNSYLENISNNISGINASVDRISGSVPTEQSPEKIKNGYVRGTLISELHQLLDIAHALQAKSAEGNNRLSELI